MVDFERVGLVGGLDGPPARPRGGPGGGPGRGFLGVPGPENR